MNYVYFLELFWHLEVLKGLRKCQNVADALKYLSEISFLDFRALVKTVIDFDVAEEQCNKLQSEWSSTWLLAGLRKKPDLSDRGKNYLKDLTDTGTMTLLVQRKGKY